MTLSAGSRLGAYEILSPLGAGGMGEVYRAKDTRLDRFVAIKVLPETLAQDQVAIARFEREAKAVAALSHPNILAIHDFGSQGHTAYAVMELLDGETLSGKVVFGPMAMKQAIAYAIQIARGLVAAHEKGIVHRDLKPSNVFVARDGQVKILDFGLAKWQERMSPGAATSAPTAPDPTAPGAVAGTVGYMSPEQASGQPLDYRSDQFALGSILYEMATGKRAFQRKTAAETLVAIIREEPEPMGDLNPRTPAPLRWIVERCLAKDPQDRYDSTRDLARDLETVEDHSTTTGFNASRAARAPRRFPLWISAAATAIAAGAVGGLFLLEHFRTPIQPEFRRLTFREGIVTRALFAPNGSILYSASWEGNPVHSYLALPESTGIDRLLDSEPQLPLSFSKDGAQVLVLLGVSPLSVSERGTLAWWPSLGGKSRRIVENAGWADAAGSGRFLAVVRDLGAERVLELHGADGALRRTLFRTSGSIWFVRISPDEREVAFVHHPFRGDNTGEVQIAAIDGSGSKPVTRRFEQCSGLDWSAKTGEIWFSASTKAAFRSGALWTVRPSGEPRSRYVLPDLFTLQSISDSGDRILLTSRRERIGLNVQRGPGAPRDLSWLGWTIICDISPDGKTALFYDGSSEKTSGVWIRPLEGGDAIRLGEGYPGKFSPDGRWVVAVTRPLSGSSRLTLIPVEAGGIRLLPSPGGDVSGPSFAGPSTLLFVRSEKGVSEVWVMKTDGSGARSLGASGCDTPIVSPSGSSFLCLKGQPKRSVFLYSIQSGQGRKLHELPDDRGLVYVRWNGTGDRIFGVTRDGRLLTLDASTGRLLRDEEALLAGATGQDRLVAAALDAEAETRAYSVIRASSDLYLASGIR